MARPHVRSGSRGYVLIAMVYLLGLFMGALDTGIVTPARTVIQSGLGIDDQMGVWIITVYTLAYAAAIPITGKLADRYGRKNVYVTSIALFGIGSLFCGLAQDFGSFEVLIAARAVQAIGGGGIIPVATAEFGTAFPPEKRGMALGLVGGVFGIANVFGASAGSLILDIFGQQNWQFIFYVNIPLCLFIVVAGIFALPRSKERIMKPIDGWGIGVLIVMILSLLYGLRNLDFFDFAHSIVTAEVYPYLIAFVVLLPLFVAVEKRAADPVMNLSYFKNPRIVITLVLSAITGLVLMGMIFIPQFAENALRMPAGSGGYFVIILGLFAGIGAPVSGKLIDRFGVKIILGFGLVASAAGSLFLAFVATAYPNVFTVVVSLVLIGIGMGFTMGTPLNYMMLAQTKKSESNSALATLSLVRSIGTTIAPAIMVAFLAHAGSSVQADLMHELPDQAQVPSLPYEQEVADELAKLKSDNVLKDKLADVDVPDLSSFHTIEISPDAQGGSHDIPGNVLEELQNADVTTIVSDAKDLASSLFDKMEPTVAQNIDQGLDKGLDGINAALSEMNANLAGMQQAAQAAGPGSSSLQAGIPALQGAQEELSTLHDHLQAMEGGVGDALEKTKQGYLEQIDARSDTIENTFQQGTNEGFRGLFTLVGICSLAGLVMMAFYRSRTA